MMMSVPATLVWMVFVLMASMNTHVSVMQDGLESTVISVSLLCFHFGLGKSQFCLIFHRVPEWIDFINRYLDISHQGSIKSHINSLLEWVWEKDKKERRREEKLVWLDGDLNQGPLVYAGRFSSLTQRDVTLAEKFSIALNSLRWLCNLHNLECRGWLAFVLVYC